MNIKCHLAFIKMDKELAHEIINLLGEERINELYNLANSEPVSFAKLMRIIREQKLHLAVTNHCCFKDIATKHKVSKMTVYRIHHARKKMCLNDEIEYKK